MTTTATRVKACSLATALILALAACGTSGEQARQVLYPADTAPPTTAHVITYESYGPGPNAWIPLTTTVPSTVTAGSPLTVSGTCGPGWEGEPSGVALIVGSMNTAPPWPRYGWSGDTPSTVAADGSFSQTIVATVPPGTYYFGLSCAAEAWLDDALYPDGNGGTIVRYYEYPASQLRAVTVVAAAPTTTSITDEVTIPPTR